MRNFLYITIIAISVSFVYSQTSFAECVEGPTDTVTCNTNPPNPDPTGVKQAGNNNNLTVNVLPGAGIDTIPANGGNGGAAIETEDGNDQITVTDANLSARLSDAIEAGRGLNIINIIRSTLSVPIGGDAIDTGNDKDIINITDSILFGGNEALCTQSGDDEVTITRSTLTNGVGFTIALGGGDDTLTLNTGAEIIGIKDRGINCSRGFDTIVFAMDVPEDLLALFSSQIATATLPDGSITINGLFYEWRACELLVNDLVGVRNIRPIPTLSQWGLIAMAAVLGIVGFMVIRRRKVTA